MNKLNPPDVFAGYISDFDKAEYHGKAESFPKTADYYQAYIHIGFFLGFLAEAYLLKADILKKKKVKQFLTHEIRPGELCKFLGGKISPLDLTDAGKKFSYFYYPGSDEKGDVTGISNVVYLEEYQEVLSEQISAAGDPYLISDSWENYSKVKQRIEERYSDWISAGKPEPRYREFKGLDIHETEKVKTYVRNTLATGLLSKNYPNIVIEENFKSCAIEIDSLGDRALSARFYSSEAKIREYLRSLTDKHIWFKLK